MTGVCPNGCGMDVWTCLNTCKWTPATGWTWWFTRGEKQQIASLPKTDAHVIAYATNRCLRCDAKFYPDGGWQGIDCHKVRRAEGKT